MDLLTHPVQSGEKDGASVARRKLSTYHHLLLEGCGKPSCENRNCASSGCVTKLSRNEAAARALQLLKENAPVCEEFQKLGETSSSDPTVFSAAAATSSRTDINGFRAPGRGKPTTTNDVLNARRQLMGRRRLNANAMIATSSELPTPSNNNNNSKPAHVATPEEGRDHHLSEPDSDDEMTSARPTSQSGEGTPVDTSFRKSPSDDPVPSLSWPAEEETYPPTSSTSSTQHIGELRHRARNLDSTERTASFNESVVDELIKEGDAASDPSYSTLRKTIGEVFCNSDSLAKAFCPLWPSNHPPSPAADMIVLPSHDGITLDLPSLRRTILRLWDLPARPFMASLCNAVNHLCDNLLLDLKYQGLYDRDPTCLNIFVLLMELPAIDSHEYFDTVLPNVCKASSALPVKGQAALARYWAKMDTTEILLKKVQLMQHFISMRVMTSQYTKTSPMQDDAALTSAATLLRIVFYAALYAGWREEQGMLERRLAQSNRDGGTGDEHDLLAAELGVRASDVRRPLVAFEDFYNEVVSEHVEMDVDFLNFKLRSSIAGLADERSRFSFMLEVPFLLTPACKMTGFWFDNRIRMYSERRQAAVQTLLNGESVTPYLKLRIRRDAVVQDALVQLDLVSAESPSDLKKQLFVEFDGEQGVDEGGLSKEFFLLITQQLFNPDYGMWTLNPSTRLYWFSPQDSTIQRDEYGLIGVLFGLAIYNNVILDVQFPGVLYRKLMGKPGVLDDLKDVDPTLHQSLHEMLTYESEDFEEVFCQTFEISYTDVFGHTHSHKLKSAGGDEVVTKENRVEFVLLYVDFLLNGLIKPAFTAFQRGFYLVINDSPLPWIFRPEEIEELVCGSAHWDFKALEDNADYDNGLSANHELIKWFWSVVHDMSEDDRRLLLQFTTGSDRVPVGGLANVKFIISRNGPDSDQLPTAHTCYNVILLPEYSSREKLKDRLMIAIKNCKGFGLQ